MATATVGALRVVLGANTAEFTEAMDRAQLKAQTTIKSVERLAHSFSGQKLVNEADRMVQAIEKVGGVSKLTAGELDHVNKVIDQVNQKFKALGQEVPPHIQLIEREIKQLNRTQQQNVQTNNEVGLSFGKLVGGLITAQAVIGTVKSLWSAYIGLLQSSVQSFANAEAAETKLVAALRAQGTATPEVIDQQKELAAEFQRTTVYADDLLMEMQGLLVQVGNVAPQEMGKALKAATDLASGLGIDLRTATMLVGKAFEGETGTLKRYGIVIDEAKLKAEGVTAVLDAVNQRFGGQAQAQAATYAGQIQQLSNAWDDLKEKIGGAIATSPEVNAILFTTTQILQDMTRESGEATTAVGKLWQAWETYISVGRMVIPGLMAWNNLLQEQADKAEAARQAASIKPPPSLALPQPLPNIGGAGLKLVEEDAKRAAKALEEAKRAAEAFKKAQDQLFGRDLIQRGNDFAKQLGDVANVSQLSVEKKQELHKAVTAAIDAYQRLGRTAPKALQDIAAATRPLLESTRQWAVVELKQAVDNTTEFEASVRSLGIDAVPQLSASIHASRLGFVGFKETVHDTREGIKQAEEATEGFGASLQKAFADLPRLIQAGLTGGGGLTGALKAFVSGLGADLGKQLFEGIQKQLGGALTGLFGKTLGGALSAALPGLGAALGALLGPLAGKLAGLFGGVSAEVKKAREELKGFQETLRSALTPSQKQEAGNQQWKMDLIAVRDLYLSIGKTAEEAERDVAAMWDTDNPDRMRAAIERVNEAMERQRELREDATGIFEDIMELGRNGIPAAMQPAIDRFIQLGLLTDDQIARLHELGAAGEVDVKKMEDAVAALNGRVDQLGPKFQQAKINETAKGYINAIQTLIDGGADVGAVLFDAQQELSELAQQSLRTGAKLPANLKPWIEELHRAGLLVDEQGNKLEDISGIEYGEAMKTEAEIAREGWEKLLTKIEELISHLRGPLVDAINNIPTERTIRVGVEYDGDAPTFGPEPELNVPMQEFAQGTMGVLGKWFGRFSPRGTLARLHGNEAVITPEQALPFAQAVMAEAMGKVGRPDIPMPAIDIPLPPRFEMPTAPIHEKTPATASGEFIREFQQLNRKFDDFTDTIAIRIRDAALGAV